MSPYGSDVTPSPSVEQKRAMEVSEGACNKGGYQSCERVEQSREQLDSSESGGGAL